MGHTPFGYNIENGKVVIDEVATEKIKKLYEYYLSGLSLSEAAKKAEMKAKHGTVGRMLKNQHYLGDDYYPPIIDADIFKRTEEERLKRAKALVRVFEPKDEPTTIPKFMMGTVIQQYENPFKQAEYAYSLIEMVVSADE
ncbi:MAG TPA: recombinase [Lachnospiraceae bacterium]|nr:recombinase [Lachnospiraceae bacterium]